MNNQRGSTWNKWDFHIHTPYSILNNDFGFNPNDDNRDTKALFDEYVKTLFTKAIEKNIVAIGITDYFSIDGYKRIRNEYLSNPNAMETLFPDSELRRKINNLFVFPNIEFRLNTFVGENRRAVNYHILFSDRLSAADIEESFLQRIQLDHSANSTLPLTANSIERIGREYKKFNNIRGKTDYRAGLEKITVSSEQVVDVIRDSSILEGQYLIAIPVDEDLSRVSWAGRDYQTRKVLYQQSHVLMSSNSQTREWALAKGNEERQIAEFGSIKPCIWGSDAHSYERLFSPDEERFCWIKADPSFEGLQQILYEPEDRVCIQKSMPDEKDSHQIIDYIRFDNKDFQKEAILLNEGLTAIIGGKSTGKTILLRHIAKGIDEQQVIDREERVTGLGNKYSVKAEVIWKDGVAGKKRIIYIPQSWLNHIVDESSGESQLNTMLKEILLQQEEIKEASIELNGKLSAIKESIKHSILDFVATVDKIDECEQDLLNFGRSNAFESVISQLEKQREELSEEEGITEEQLTQYSVLERTISEQKDLLDEIEKEKTKLELQDLPFAYITSITILKPDGTPKYDLGSFPLTGQIINDAAVKMNDAIEQIWTQHIQRAIEIITDKHKCENGRMTNLQKNYSPIQEMVSRNEELKKLEAKIQEENGKLKKAKKIEKNKADNQQRLDEIKNSIFKYRLEIHQVYTEFASKVSSLNSTGSELEFEADVRDRKQELFDGITSLFDNRNLRSFKDKYNYNLQDKDEFVINEDLFKSILTAMLNHTLTFKGGNDLKTALEKLFSDWFYVHYDIKSGGDTISNMSPGKKALVLLEMIVNLERSKCPILIDQPEDDLDNRSIFADLVSYLKTKKHERQIIIVTHNANVVIGADAEEVIIANQQGKESPNKEKRFEYRSGAIENISPVLDSNGILVKGVLNQKGIQEQICDILEGGKEAFELRRKKYIRI